MCPHYGTFKPKKKMINEFYDPEQAVPQLLQYSVTQTQNMGYEATHTLGCSDNTHWCIS